MLNSKRIRIQLLSRLAAVAFLVMAQSLASGICAEELTRNEQKELVSSVYESTRTAKTAKDYSAFIEKCNDALEQDLSEKNRGYLKALAAWGLNRRGEKRLDVGQGLRAADNIEQGDEVLIQALADFDEATKFDPARVRAWHFRGIANVKLFRMDEAESDFSKVIELKPDDLKAHFNRAEVRYQTGLYAQAITDYNRVLEDHSGDVEALTGRAHCHYAMANFVKAFSDYDSVAQLTPNHPMALINRADAHQMVGQWKDAYADYNSAVAMKPTGIGYQKLAWMLATCPDQAFNRPQESLKFSQLAIELDGETQQNLDTRAAAEAANGNFDVAKKLQQRALVLAESKDKEMQARMSLYRQGKVYRQAAVSN